MGRIALINQKGGVGKTTSAINIGAGLTRLKKKVLLIDLDPQAHLTYGLGIPAHELDWTVYELLKAEATLEQTSLEKNGLTVLPSSLDLSGAEFELSAVAGREVLLREALDGVQGFNFILIDCPPSLGLITLNALTAVNEVYIPLQAQFYALQGMSKLVDTIETVRRRLNPDLRIAGIIGTQYDSRKNLNKEVISSIRQHFGGKVFKTVIRDNVALAEAPGFGQDIFTYRPHSHGAEDYLALCEEILRRNQP